MVKRRLSLVLAAALSLAALPLFAQQAAGTDGRYLIKFKNFQGASQAVRAAGGNPVLELAEQSAIAAYLPAQAIEGLRHNPNVELVEEDALRWPMAQVTPYGITMVQADQVSDANAGNTTICIIDSGYYTAHEDLAGNQVTGVNNSGTGNWYEDSCGHGTHVAGTISALANSTGVVGVLPNGHVNLRAQKVFNNADCKWTYASTLVQALNNCRAALPAGQRLVVSMSLGGNVSSVTENNAFQSAYNAGVLSVAAAGNAGTTQKSYPASYASVISVAAVDSNKALASFSQRNSSVELAAPGVGVLSTVPFAASSVTAAGIVANGENIEGSARTNASGTLVDGGLCSTAGSWAGQVVLCQRGTDTFATKVASVKNGGGVAAVIYNNVSGGFSGTLNGTSTIPAISISQEDGNTLKSGALNAGAVVANAGGVGSGYAYYDGTSMATPHVSGVAALVWSNVPSKTNAEIRAALQITAEDLGTAGKDNSYGYGLIRAKAALDYLGGGSPPANQAPVASFNRSCTNLDCSFTSTSTDADGTVASWSWDFGDGGTANVANPSHTFASEGTKTVTLVVTDNNGAASNTASQTFNVTAAPPPGSITLQASGFKNKGVNNVNLSWSGTSGSSNVYRNGGLIATVPSGTTTYTDNTGTKGAASFTYKVCNTSDTSVCSSNVTIVF